jgi:hypothetical protein
MGSSGVIDGLTVPARNTHRGEHGPPRRSVDGLANGPHGPDLNARPLTQPVVVLLQIFDDILQVANTRPQASSLEDETIVPIHSLTQ